MSLPKIEQVTNPQVGRFYMVRMVKISRDAKFSFSFRGQWVPVFGNVHTDQHCLNFIYEHQHLDWRFVSSHIYHNETLWFLDGRENGVVVYSPDVEEGPVYRRAKMKREHSAYPKISWQKCLEDDYQHVKLKAGMICPHQGANLTSCRQQNDIVECPLHGLRWNVSTGALVRRESTP